jgi:hypothetical protein
MGTDYCVLVVGVGEVPPQYSIDEAMNRAIWLDVVVGASKHIEVSKRYATTLPRNLLDVGRVSSYLSLLWRRGGAD